MKPGSHLSISLKISAILFFMLFSSNTFAQQYHPYPEENAFWTVAEFNWNTWEYDTYLYTVKGDTFLHNKNYKKVYQLNDIPSSNDTSWTLHNLMRQEVDQKKIYFIRIYQGDTTERLGFDFDVQIGDTVYLPAFDYANTGDSIFHVVDPGSDSTQLNNGEYRKNYFYMSLDPYSDLDMYVIEGVGTQRTAFPNLFFYDPFHQSGLTCLIVNDEHLYGDTPELCSFTVDINYSKPKNKLIIKPNPAGESIFVQYPDNMESAELFILNSTGTTVIRQSIARNKTATSIDVSKLPGGIYIVLLIGKERFYSRKTIINH